MSRYVIKITAPIDGSRKASNAVAKTPKASRNTAPKPSKGEGNGDIGTAIGKGIIVFNKVRSTINPVVNYLVSTVSLRTGSQELQSKIDFTKQVIDDGIDVVEASVTGAMVGGGAGAIVGVVTGLAQKTYGYILKSDSIMLKQNLEKVSNDRAIIRATSQGSRGGRND